MKKGHVISRYNVVKARIANDKVLLCPKSLTLTFYYYKNTTVTVIQFLLWFQQINCRMLKNVSRHYSSCVRNMSPFFDVFLNNEKLPFILELSSNNQMYLSIINVIYSVPPNKSFYFCLNMVFLFLCNR